MRIFFIFVFSLIVIELNAQCSSLSDGVVFEVLFQNSTVSDLSGNDIIIVNYGAVATNDRCGNINSAFLFDGSSNYMSIQTTNLVLTEYTYSLWVNPMSNTIVQAPLSIGGATGGDQAVKISNSIIEAVSWDVGPHVSVASASSTFNIGTWYHIVTTRNGNFVKIYLDGALVNATSTSGYTITYSNNTVLGFIGARVNSDQYFNGAIDDLRIYNRVLCDSEILELYNNSCVISGTEKMVSSENQFNLYPNPTNSKFKIASQYPFDKNISIEVYNTIGQTCFSSELIQGELEYEVDLSFKPAGIYQCIITPQGKSPILKKIIVK